MEFQQGLNEFIYACLSPLMPSCCIAVTSYSCFSGLTEFHTPLPPLDGSSAASLPLGGMEDEMTEATL